jgi:hypothetical protein
VEVDSIISYHDLATEEKAALLKGMHYGVGKNYSVFLRSLRGNALYAHMPRKNKRARECATTLLSRRDEKAVPDL